MKKRILSLLLVVVMLCAVLTGCTGKPPMGNWSCTIDFTKTFSDMLGNLDTASDYSHLISIRDITVKTTWRFNKDGTYSIEVNQASLDRAADNLESSTRTSMRDVFTAYISDLIKEHGLSMSVFEFLDYSGMDLDSTVDEIAKTSREALEKSFDIFNQSGTYEVDGDIITLTSDDGSVDTFQFSVSGGKMELNPGPGENFDNELVEIFPLVLVKAKK